MSKLASFDPNKIEIMNIRVYYDESTSTRTRETANMLQYESQHFKCKVTLKFQDSFANENWSVGLIQACDYMYLENRYGNTGSSFWEFHPLKSGRHQMVNDSDGRQYPFYSRVNSKCEVRRGVLTNTLITLQYDDHFYPTVAWELPQCNSSRLTDVIRLQDFWVWLVAVKRSAGSRDLYYDHLDVGADTVYVMRTMRWRYNLHMTFDPYQAIGHRLVGIADQQNEQPYICTENKQLPISALSAPHCNAGQSLIWYPSNRGERCKLLVPPYQIISPWQTWCGEMVPSGSLVAQRPKDCQLVPDFLEDTSVGVTWPTVNENAAAVHKHAAHTKRMTDTSISAVGNTATTAPASFFADRPTMPVERKMRKR